MSEQILFTNFALLEPTFGEIRHGYQLLIEDDKVKELSDRPVKAEGAARIDCGGRTLMPGLIDSHVHAIHSEVNIRYMENLPLTLVAARAATRLTAMLNRGFTTVRDTGGADWGLKTAIETGHIVGPRLFIAGQSIGPTGGHSDSRRRTSGGDECMCCNGLQFKSAVADGVDAVRKAVREEIKAGADQIKVMASGGVASPTDPIDFFGYSRDELMAAVEEATNSRTYVMAHAYTAEAIARAVECGVRSIEHANLVDAKTAKLMTQRGAFAVPTLVTYEALATEGASLGLPPESVAKIERVRGAGIESLDIFRKAGTKVAFGSDLLGDMHRHQATEFAIRARVLPAHEIVASATSVAADLLNMTGKLGVVAPGAFADLLVVDGDPLKDATVLAGQGENLRAILKNGKFHKNELN